MTTDTFARLQANKAKGDLALLSPAIGAAITKFGAIGTSDDSLVFQAAIDALDGTGIPLALTGDVNLRGTVYLGDNQIRFNGFAINCIIDGSYTQRGTATRRTGAVILTKSATAAGYGRATVGIEFLDRATVNTTRTVDTGTVSAGLLLEATSSFQARTLEVNAVGTGNSDTTPLDFFQGVQGVVIDTVIITRNQGVSQGGFWIRSRSATRMTRDINIGTILFSGNGVDEFVAIYNSADANADISDVHIGSIIGTIDGGSGIAVSIFRNVGNYDDTKMRNITVGTIKVEVNSMMPASATVPFIVKIDKSAPRIGKVEIEFNATFPSGMTGIVGLRGPLAGSGQTVLPYIGDYSFRLNSANVQPSGQADIANGSIDFGRFAVRGTGSGWKYAGRLLRNIADARVNDVTLDFAFDGADSVSGYVEGRMNNVYAFRGTHVINTDRFTAANWWFHNATANHWNNTLPLSLTYDADIRLTGAGTVSRIILAQSNPANLVPIAARYRASNPGNVVVSNPDTAQNKTYFASGQYNCTITNGTVAANRGRTTTLTVSSGSITPTFEYHLVTAGGILSDILGPNGGAPFDGQELNLRAASGSFTIKHNTGSAGTKTWCGTLADIVVTDGGWARLAYHAPAARWEIRS